MKLAFNFKPNIDEGTRQKKRHQNHGFGPTKSTKKPCVYCEREGR